MALKGDKHYRENLSNMMCLDIYLMSLSNAGYQQIKHRIRPLPYTPHPLLSWGVSAPVSQSPERSDLQVLQEYAQKYSWQADILNIVQSPYQALVLTDHRLVIQWASNGFAGMTGYAVEDAIGRTPKFLQGANTSEEARQNIRRRLRSHTPFTEEIINYRQNGEEYLCRVQIVQLINSKNRITHFLALESEVK